MADVSPPQDVVLAAGAVLWRPGADGPELALVHRPRYDDWSLPKGKLDPGEHPLAAAVREVREETGVQAVVGRRLPGTRYRNGQGQPKQVSYWAMRAGPGEFVPDHEVDLLSWLPPEAALRRLSYAHDREPVEAMLGRPYDTTSLLLVRHARAGSRQEWPAEDRLRPLDPTGAEQAERIAALLPAFAPCRVVSADLSRCVETVQPLAAGLGVAVELEPALDESSHGDVPERSLRRLRELVGGAGPVVVCSQGGVIPDLVSTLAEQDGLALADGVPARKGSTWVLSFAGGRLVDTEYIASA